MTSRFRQVSMCNFSNTEGNLASLFSTSHLQASESLGVSDQMRNAGAAAPSDSESVSLNPRSRKLLFKQTPQRMQLEVGAQLLTLRIAPLTWKLLRRQHDSVLTFRE